MAQTTRRNRRSTTDGLVIRDNRVYGIRVMSEGYGSHRVPPMWYRRHVQGQLVTGLAH